MSTELSDQVVLKTRNARVLSTDALFRLHVLLSSRGPWEFEALSDVTIGLQRMRKLKNTRRRRRCHVNFRLIYKFCVSGPEGKLVVTSIPPNQKIQHASPFHCYLNNFARRRLFWRCSDDFGRRIWSVRRELDICKVVSYQISVFITWFQKSLVSPVNGAGTRWGIFG